MDQKVTMFPKASLQGSTSLQRMAGVPKNTLTTLGAKYLAWKLKTSAGVVSLPTANALLKFIVLA